MNATRTEKVTATKVWHALGNFCGMNCPWMVSANGHTVGRFEVARFQPDPMVFRTRQAARDFAARLNTVNLYADVCSANRLYVVPTVAN